MDFPDTRWTLIAQLQDETRGRLALDGLCAAYWQPICVYLLQAGRSRAEAEDLTQEFLEMVMRQRLLERANPVLGRLRSWLLTALQHFVANARRYETRQKRGGGAALLPLHHPEVARELAAITSQGLSPDEAFDRAWVAALLRQVLEILTRQYREAGRENDFQALLPWLLDHGPVPQLGAAKKAGMTLANFRVQLHRLRSRYRETLRQRIVATLEHDDDYQAELEYLFRITGRQV